MTVLISIGGGITGDVSGFAASIFKRGIKVYKYSNNAYWLKWIHQ